MCSSTKSWMTAKLFVKKEFRCISRIIFFPCYFSQERSRTNMLFPKALIAQKISTNYNHTLKKIPAIDGKIGQGFERNAGEDVKYLAVSILS